MSTFAVVRPPSTGSTQPASVSRLRFMRATTRIATRIASLTVILTLLTSLPSGYWRPTRMTPVMSIVHAPWRMAEMTRALPDFIAGICTSTPPSRLATPMMCRARTTFLRISMERMLPTPCRGGDCRELSIEAARRDAEQREVDLGARRGRAVGRLPGGELFVVDEGSAEGVVCDRALVEGEGGGGHRLESGDPVVDQPGGQAGEQHHEHGDQSDHDAHDGEPASGEPEFAQCEEHGV